VGRLAGLSVLLMQSPHLLMIPTQHIVERYRALSPDGFWVEFSTEGKRQSYTRITTSLRTQRASADKDTAERARLEYGASFDTVFSYRLGSGRRVMNTNQKIAERYRELHTDESA
jgi:hypothetical protein